MKIDAKKIVPKIHLYSMSPKHKAAFIEHVKEELCAVIARELFELHESIFRSQTDTYSDNEIFSISVHFFNETEIFEIINTAITTKDINQALPAYMTTNNWVSK